jgi:hypothetical protein
MQNDIVRDHSYTPTDRELLWREQLGRIADQAMACSDDLVAPVSAYQHAALAAVGVTWGVASHADLRDAANETLEALRDFVNVEPMRRALRKVIAEIDAEHAAGAPGAVGLLDVDEADNVLGEGHAPPRKQRAS